MEDAERMDRGNLQWEPGDQRGRKGDSGKKKKEPDSPENEVQPRVRTGEGEMGRPATLLEERGFSSRTSCEHPPSHETCKKEEKKKD
ncbi:hypothetical protein NDU88_000140 [Pleurodeles waltl]|uniref:Uncharacterized protein n=1 Tax=Pleurodeles waltl TaxID=8319 RepID=A0AAV7Q298_PLEWA|nr:hypothetical protein NDU88_000140 [Pleurodeles waltl]